MGRTSSFTVITFSLFSVLLGPLTLTTGPVIQQFHPIDRIKQTDACFLKIKSRDEVETLASANFCISRLLAVPKQQSREHVQISLPHEPNCTLRRGCESQPNAVIRLPVAPTSAVVKAHTRAAAPPPEGNHRPSSQKPQDELVRRLAEVKCSA